MKLRALTLLAVAGLAAGCTRDDNASVFVDAVCFPPEPTDGQCVVSNACELFMTGIPFVDLDLTGDSFVLPIRFQNQLEDNADSTTGNTNTHIAFVDSLKLTYRVPAQDRNGDGAIDATEGAFVLEDVPAPMTSFSIPAPGTSVAWMELIAPGVAQTLVPSGLNRVTIEVHASGETNGGETIDSGGFQIVADMCRGCVTLVSPCAVDEIATFCPQPGQSGSVGCTAVDPPPAAP